MTTALAPLPMDLEPLRDNGVVEFENGEHVRVAPIQIFPPYVQEIRDAQGIYRWFADDPDAALAHIDTIRADAQVKAATRYLGLQAVGNDQWGVEPESVEFTYSAQITESALRRIPRFTDQRRMMVEDGVVSGMGLLSTTWERVAVRLRPDTQVRWWWLPVALKHVDKRRLRLIRQRPRRDVAYWSIWEPGTDRYIVIEDRHKRPTAAITMQDFVWLKLDERERSAGYGEGLNDTLYELVTIKLRTVAYRAILAERWAEPTFLYKFDPTKGLVGLMDASESAMYASPTSRAETMNAILHKWRARHSLSYPTGDELTIHEHGAAASAAHEAFMEFLNAEIRTVLLASPTTLGERRKGGLGGGGQEEAGKDATQDVIDFYRTAAEEAFTRDVVDQFVERNGPQLMALGFAVPGQGELKMRFGAKPKIRHDELKTKLEVAQMANLQVGTSWVRDAIDIPRPGVGEEIVTFQQPAMSVPGMGGGFGGGGSFGSSGGFGGSGTQPQRTTQFSRFGLTRGHLPMVSA